MMSLTSGVLQTLIGRLPAKEQEKLLHRDASFINCALSYTVHIIVMI